MDLETIYIVRHGIAENSARSGLDADRRLSDVGIDRTDRAARGMKIIGVRPDTILFSPLRRAEETARIVSRILGDIPARICPPLAPGFNFDELSEEFFKPPKPSKILVVGHQPDLGMLASRLATGDPGAMQLPFRKAATACFEVYGSPQLLRGTLQWFMTPHQLRGVRE